MYQACSSPPHPPTPDSLMTGLGVGVSLDSASDAALSSGTRTPTSHSFLGLQGSRERVEYDGALVTPQVLPGA